jgi:hypothetical protein
MKHSEESLRQQIALGWVASLTLLATTLIGMMLQGMFTETDFIGLRTDPGYQGLFMLKLLSGIYVFTAIGVYAFGSSRFFRWIALIAAILMFLLMVMHHLSHWVAGQRLGIMSHVMDVLHHVSMGWVVLNSIRWVRAPKTAP